MKKNYLIPSLLSLGIFLPSSAIAATFSSIYGFGDSLSDRGNINQLVSEATGGNQTFPPSPPYAEGRFSNGPIWGELLAQRLNIPLIDLAFGGATTGSENTLDTTLPGLPLLGLQQQIANFALNNPTADPTALYTIWMGANDYLPTNSIGFSPYSTDTIPLRNIENAVNTLVGLGAKEIMILNLPNLGEVPLTNASLDGNCPVNNQFDADCLNNLTRSHNQGLSSLFSSLPVDVNIIQVDVNTLLNNIITNPAQFGLTNVTEGCLDLNFIPCDNPEQYLFWDSTHPTTRVHELIANQALESLVIPEANTIAGSIALGLIGVGWFVKNKSQ
ncbi:MAG: G-D-S-L family lipolytic protein [Gloeocapsa sp. DLM2.Bin57]|nr:MAG: G-D-S-L family lipolytic protein [Gloeocapsa sp. DLM2.Bin57]